MANAGITIQMVPYDMSIEVAWKDVLKGLTKMLTQGFLAAYGKADGPANAVDGLVEAATAIKVQQGIGAQSWTLFWLCFSWSLDQLRSVESFDEEEVLGFVKEMISEAENLPAEKMEMPISFLNRPSSLPLYIFMRDSVVKNITFLRPNTNEEIEILKNRLNSIFERSVFEIWSRRPETFNLLANVLKYPGIESAQMALQWEAYRQKLIFDFEVSAVFGQERLKLPLSAVYIPLRAVHYAYQSSKIGIVSRHYVNIERYVNNWLFSSDDNDDRLLIGGGPGSGKSTTMKAIAASLSKNPQSKVLFVPLQHIALDGNLRDTINSFFRHWTGGAFIQEPLTREMVEDTERLLIIFDGLDEIARPGTGADEVASLFLLKLDHLVSSLRGDVGKRIKVIVTGRMPSFQAAKKFSSIAEDRALEVCGYVPLTQSKDPDVDEGAESENSLMVQEDQRLLWWSRYSSVVGFPNNPPDALTDTRLTDVTNEPLLCYLLVLSGFMTDDWENAAKNRNLIYEKLINEVWRRGWGEGSKETRRQGPGRSLTLDDFNLLMDTIALAAWMGGDTRVASEKNFHQAVKVMNSDSAWDNFRADNGQDVTNLAMNFYLKASEGEKRGFEFTHKAFGDYLAARAILRIAEDIVSLVPRRTDAAMQAWLEATATGVLTAEILIAMRDEIRLLQTREDTDNRISEIFSAFENLARIALVEGIAKSGWLAGTWRDSVKYELGSGTMIWAVLNSCALVVNRNGRIRRRIRVGFSEDRGLFKNFLSRIGAISDWDHPVITCFAYIEADDSDLFGLPMYSIDLRGSLLRRVNFNGSHLIGANLSFSQISNARFERAHLDRCKFQKANVNGCNFVDSRKLSLSGASFKKIVLSYRTLLDFSLEMIQGLDFSKIRITHDGNVGTADQIIEVMEYVQSIDR